MYVDDRLGRRSRARSGLDQLDVAEDLFAVVAAAVAVGGAAVFHVGMGDRLRFSSSSGFASEFRFDDTGAVLLVPLEGRRESSDIDGRRTTCQARAGRGAAFIVVLGPAAAQRRGAVAAIGQEPPRRGRRRRPGQSAPER